MKVTIKAVTPWNRVLNAARLTAHMPSLVREPSEEWVRKALIEQHSPIRLREYDILLEGIPYYVMVHLVRHFVGVEKFVTTSRDDRVSNDIPRAEKPQGALVDMQLSVNAQSLMNISYLRLCANADPETRKVWRAVKIEMEKVDSVMAEAMTPRCERLHFCPERASCGYYKNKQS